MEAGTPSKIASSKNRLDIESKIIAGVSAEEICMYALREHNEVLTVPDIEEYKAKYILPCKGLIHKIAESAKDLSKREIPPVSEVDRLSGFFSFQKANEDLDMIYSRIKELKALAVSDPSEDSYDKRIAEYLKRVDAIKASLLKNQFEDLRRSVLMNIGKKIAIAAINTLLPFIKFEDRDVARQKFMRAIEPLVNPEVPQEPEEIQEIRRSENGEPTKVQEAED